MYTIRNRFRGFLPVVVDVETAGFNAQTDAVLEIAASLVEMDEDEGWLRPGELISEHVVPFEGANLDPKALEFTGIDPFHPLRLAKQEADAFRSICQPIRAMMKETGCKRAILVGHNPQFDIGFINALVERNKFKRSPFHPFSTFDTATLAGLAYGQTVLARAVQAAELDWDQNEAHSARYDTERTAALFCSIVNFWHEVAGVPESIRPPGDLPIQ